MVKMVDGLPVAKVRGGWGGRRPGAGAPKGTKRPGIGGACKGNKNGCIFDRTMDKACRVLIPPEMVVLLDTARGKLKKSRASFIRTSALNHAKTTLQTANSPLVNAKRTTVYHKDSPEMAVVNFKMLKEDYAIIEEAAKVTYVSAQAFIRKAALLDILKEVGTDNIPNSLVYILR